MSLAFLLGTGQNDSQQRFIAKAQDFLAADPQNEVFFLVPNYNKFEQEILLLSELSQKATTFSTIRTKVFSFNRLAWYFLQTAGFVQGVKLTETGRFMLFRQVLTKVKKQLTVFQGEVNKPGFLAQLDQLYQEFHNGNIEVASLVSQMGQGELDWQRKVKDLEVIFQAYEALISSLEVDDKDVLLEFNRFLNSPAFKKTADHKMFMVTGFTRFSAKEMQVIELLMQTSPVQFSLLLDQAYPTEAPHPLELFHDTGKLYFQLKQRAQALQVPVTFDEQAKPTTQPLNQLAKIWENPSLIAQGAALAGHLHFWQVTDPATEVNKLAVTIKQLINQNENLRYKDIQVLTRDFGTYGGLIKQIFNANDLPYFLDEEQTMAHHPLIEFLQVLFQLDTYYYRQKDVFRFLKTELFVPAEFGTKNWQQERLAWRDLLDRTENICLAYNFQGHHWTRKEDWQFVQYDFEDELVKDSQQLEQDSNAVRRLVKTQVPPFFKKMKAAPDGKTAASLFYQFLIDCGVSQEIRRWRDQAVKNGELEQARNHEQTWQALMDLLDEYVFIYGEEKFSWTVFQEVFMAGLVGLTYGKVPSTIDQVKINNLELVRPSQAKITFAIGLNDQVFPTNFIDQGLLTPEERQQINEQLTDEAYLPEGASAKVMRESFLAYLVFLSATEQLYLSYAMSDDSKKELTGSTFVTRLTKQTGLPFEKYGPVQVAANPSDHVASWRGLLGQVNRVYRQAIDEKVNVPSIWQQLEKQLAKSPVASVAQKVLAGRTHLNVVVPIESKQADLLYGKDLHVSISRIESFYHCQYQYFANYGLRLKERELYQLSPAAAGDFFHEALDQFFKLISNQGIDLVTLTGTQRLALAEEVLATVFKEPRFGILTSSARMKYIAYQLSQTIQRVVWGLNEQAKRTGFTPQQTEVLFGQIGAEKGIDGLELDLKDHRKLFVRGKIDRLDKYEKDGQLWLSVVDYKSSDHSFNIAEAYYGLALQLTTYLDVALQDAVAKIGDVVHGAGAYYFHVHNPTFKPIDNLETQPIKEYQFDGFFVNDSSVFSAFDHSLSEKETSIVFPIKKDLKGNLTKVDRTGNKFYTEAEMSVLRQHNRKLMVSAGNELLTGQVALNPSYQGKEKRACTYCQFRSVCQFDVMLKENNYHRLDTLSKKEVFEKLTPQENDEAGGQK